MNVSSDVRTSYCTLMSCSFANVIVYLEVVQDEAGREDYDAAIQFQCQEDETGILFTGLNFLTKSPTVSDEQLDRMFQSAIDLGLGWAMEDGTGTHLMDQTDCVYPRETMDAIHEEWQNGLPE